jgi:hypothetical protein
MVKQGKQTSSLTRLCLNGLNFSLIADMLQMGVSENAIDEMLKMNSLHAALSKGNLYIAQVSS